MALKERIQAFFLAILAISLVLSIATWFLATKGQVNHFPTYLAALAWLGTLINTPSGRTTSRDPLRMLVAILILYLGATALWGGSLAPGPIGREVGVSLLLLAFVFGLSTAHRQFETFLPGFFGLLVLAASVSAAISIYLYHDLQFRPPSYEDDRMYGLGRLANPVVSGLSYGVALIVASYEGFRRPGPARWACAGAGALLLYAIVLGGTRAVWLGLAAAALVAIGLVGRWQPSTRIAVIAGLLLAGAGVALGLWLIEPDSGLFRRALSFRPVIWAGVLEQLAGWRWLFGHGINTASATTADGLTFDHAHSIYIGTLFHAGLVGLVLLAGVLTGSVWRVARSRAEPRHLAAPLLAYGALVLVVDGDTLLDKMDYPWLVFWLPVALVLCLPTASGSLEHGERSSGRGVPGK